MSSNIYRRGAIYWWRRSVRCALGALPPTMVRISLRTAVLALARTRAAWLEMQIGSVGMEIESTAAGLKPEDFRNVYQQAYKTALDRYLALQQDTPWLEDQAILTNLAHARYFTMTAASELEPRPGTELGRRLEEENLSPTEIKRMQIVAGYYRHGSAINPNYVEAYLRQAGCSPSVGNVERARRVVALGYREACIEAAMALGAPDPRHQLPPIPRSLQAVIGEQASPSCAISAPPALAPTDLMRPTFARAPMPAQEPQGIDCQVSSLANEAVATNIENGKWSETCRGDVRGALKLFVAANGDMMLSQIRQSHLAEMCKLFARMPPVWGKTQKGGTKENPIFETVEQALERGKRMKDEWDADPVAAEIEEKPRPGLAVATRNKHLQWITSVFEFGSGHGYVKVDVDAKPLKLKDKDFKHEKRLPWEPSELAKLLSGPIWSGCAGIEHRLHPGDTIIHDAMYFAPLLITSHAARSEEVNGLMLADVIDDHSTPYIRYRDNAYRKLKTKYSRRSRPTRLVA